MCNYVLTLRYHEASNGGCRILINFLRYDANILFTHWPDHLSSSYSSSIFCSHRSSFYNYAKVEQEVPLISGQDAGQSYLRENDAFMSIVIFDQSHSCFGYVLHS